MSRTLSLYSVDIDKLAKVVGSQDTDLSDTLRTSHPDYWIDADDVDEEEGELDSAAAIRKIVTGEMSDENPSDLARGLELICVHVGEHVPMSAFQDMHYLYREQLKVLDELLETRLPFEFPDDPDGVRIGFHSSDRVRELSKTLPDAIPDHADREVNGGRIEFQELLESIADEGNDLVAFLD